LVKETKQAATQAPIQNNLTMFFYFEWGEWSEKNEEGRLQVGEDQKAEGKRKEIVPYLKEVPY
jgi:hypothetical protein